MTSLLISLAIAGAPTLGSHPAEYEPEVTELCFATGLRVTLIRDDRQPVVSVSTVMGRGSAHDPVGREGTAHLVEHLWFHAQTAEGAVSDRLADLGASFNARTLADATVYMSQADVAVLPELLHLEALRLTNPLMGVTAELIEQERTIVGSEHALKGLVTTDYPRLLPPGFGRNDSGLRPHSPQALSAITASDLAELTRGYQPDTTTIQVSGPVSPEQLRAMVEQAFPSELLSAAEGQADGQCGGRVQATDMQPAPLARRAQMHTTRLPAEVPVALVGWSLPPAYGQDEPMMRMVTRMMSRTVARRLSGARFLDARRGCELIASPVSSTLLCWATVPDGANGGRILEILSEAGGNLQATAETYEALSDVSRATAIDVIVGLDASSPLRSEDAMRAVLANHYGGSPMWFRDVLTALSDVETADVDRFMARWTRPEQGWLSVVLADDADLDRVLAGRKARAVDEPEQEGVPLAAPERSEPVGEVDHRGPSRHTAAGAAPSLPQLSEPNIVTMNNGMRIVVLQHGRAPVANSALVVSGAASTEAKLGLDEWAWSVTGVQHRAFEEERLGTYLWTQDLGHARAVGLTGSDAMLPEQFEVLRAFAESDRTLYDRVRQTRRSQLRQAARTLRNDPVFVARQAQWVHVLGPQDPQAFHSVLLANRGGRAGIQSVYRHQRSMWNPESATLYVVTPNDPDPVMTKAIALFSSWEEKRGKPQAGTSVPQPLPSERVAFEAVDSTRTSSLVQLRCRAPNDTEEAVKDVTVELLREWAHAELRESDIGAYNPSVRSYQSGVATVVSASVTVDPLRASEAAAAMDSGLEWLATDISQQDVRRVAHRLRASWAGTLVQSSDVLDALVAYGSDLPARVDSYPQALMAVQPEDVYAVAQTCSAGASLSIVAPEAGAVADSSWRDVLTEAALPKGM